MPVTFSPASSRYPAVSCTKDPANGSRDFLQRACSRQVGRADEILQSSFPEHLGDAIPVGNGLVHTLRDAYNEHHAVVIRPDDVWIAILTQFSFYVNGNAEALRKQFVQHEGKKELTVYGLGTRYTVDFGHLAKEMTRLIDENVVDPTLRQWIMPDFSTTTDNDRIVSSVVMMATMKEYFSYAGYLWCGIPRVTLEGGKRDWEEILRRAEKLKEYGHLTVAWYHLLRLVLSRFANCFDRPNATESHIFWHNVAHSSAEGSGSTYMSGWITAFCAFDSDGRWIGNPFKNDPVVSSSQH
ncbi:hypothetical protein PLICRDRAFT_40374 [Plicaturopsis crispa FD-325 SS-3]|nr:hypothetical protein PLICRDRAFT_40374 [Plicaturopsis crispa FD-325 SS-3]